MHAYFVNGTLDISSGSILAPRACPRPFNTSWEEHAADLLSCVPNCERDLNDCALGFTSLQDAERRLGKTRFCVECDFHSGSSRHDLEILMCIVSLFAKMPSESRERLFSDLGRNQVVVNPNGEWLPAVGAWSRLERRMWESSFSNWSELWWSGEGTGKPCWVLVTNRPVKALSKHGE